MFEITCYLGSLPQRPAKFSRFVTCGCMVCTKWLITHNPEMLRNLSAKEKDTLQEMTMITDISHLIGKGYFDCYSGM